MKNNGFWQFSLTLYSHKEVEVLCLKLQNEYGVNVNLFLWCLWQACEQRIIAGNQWGVATARISLVDERYVQPIRNIRNNIQRNTASDIEIKLLDSLLKAELNAEQWVQQELFQVEVLSKNFALNDALNENLEICFNHYNCANLKEQVMLQLQPILNRI